MFASVVLLFVSIATAVAMPGVKSGQQLTYRGSVAPRDVEANPAAGPSEKTFDLHWTVSEATDGGAKLYWTLDERGPGGCAWPQRFGQVALDAKGQLQPGSTPPALLYDYGDDASEIPLPTPTVVVDKPLAAGVAWSSAGRDFAVQGEQRLGERDAWQVQVRNRVGVHQNLLVDISAPLLLQLGERVFMNRGTEYELAMKLTGTSDLSAADLATTEAAFASLLALKARLQRIPGATGPWNAEQLKLLAEALPEIEKQQIPGLLSKVVTAAARDAKSQSGRADEVAALIAKRVGQPLAEFSMPGLGGGTLSGADLAGQVTVLHLWDYRDQPLKEPYGQVGYLEFLYQKRKDQGLKVYGVAVDDRLRDESGRRTAVAGIRKLKAFMNLSYPLALDGGDFLKSITDRAAGDSLPLFIVVGRDGKVTHLHVGNYEVDRQQGLKVLDAAVAAALQK